MWAWKDSYSPVCISRPPLRAQNSTGLSREPVYPAQFEGDTLSLRIRNRTGLAREPVYPAPVYPDRTVCTGGRISHAIDTSVGKGAAHSTALCTCSSRNEFEATRAVQDPLSTLRHLAFSVADRLRGALHQLAGAAADPSFDAEVRSSAATATCAAGLTSHWNDITLRHVPVVVPLHCWDLPATFR